MKEVTRERIITEVAYYEAIDGERFNSKEECEKYENTAALVILAELAPYKVGTTDPYDLYLGEGSEEYVIDIYTIPNADVLRKLNTYRMMIAKDVQIIGEEFIGKTILLQWDYEHYYSYNEGTIDDIVAKVRKAYDKAVNPEEEKKESANNV